MTPLPSSPTPPDAPTPNQLAALRDFANDTGFISTALASLLRAYEEMRADAERWRAVRPSLSVSWSGYLELISEFPIAGAKTPDQFADGARKRLSR